MNELGLGAYGSEDEEDEVQQEVELEGGNRQKSKGRLSLLGGYMETEVEDAQPAEAKAAGQALESPAHTVSGAAQAGSAQPSTSLGTPEVSGEADNNGASTQGAGLSAAAAAASSSPFSMLPPELAEPPPGSCAPELLAKFTAFKSKIKPGMSLNNSLRGNKNYHNPDLLLKLVDHFNVQQWGSAFPKEVFDPDTLPKDDFCDQLLGQLEREMARRRQQREEAAARPATAANIIQFERAAAGALPGPKLSTAGSASDLSRQANVVGNTAALREMAARNAAAVAASNTAATGAAGVKKSKWDSGA